MSETAAARRGKTGGEAGREPAYPSSGRAWWSVGVLTLLSCLSLLDRQIMALLIPDMRRDLGLTDFHMGLLQGVVFSAFYVTFGLLFGWIIDRFSRRAVIFAGVTFWSMATAACGLAGNFFQLILARFGVGAGEAALNPAGYSIISDTFPRHRLSLAMSVFGAGSYLGIGVSLVLGGYLIDAFPKEGVVVPVLGHLSAWRAVFLAAGLPGLLIAFLIWTMADPPRRGRVEQASSSIGDTVGFMRQHWRFYTGHFLGFAMLAASGYGFQVWSPTFLLRNFDIEITQVVNILAPITVIGGITGGLLAGFVTDRLFARGMRDAHLRYFMVTAVFHAVFLLLAMTSTSLERFIVFMILVNITSGYAGVGPAALQLVTPNNYRGQVSACLLFVTSLLGTGLGPVIVGGFTTYLFKDDAKVGWAIALNALVVMPLAILAFASALKPMRRAVDEAEARAGSEASGA